MSDRFVAKIVAGLLAGGALAAALLAMSQAPFPSAVFEFQNYRDIEGVIAASPYPRLLVARPGDGISQYLLVGEGKHGADVARFDRHRVRLRAELIYRDGVTLAQVSGVHDLGSSALTLPMASLGRVDLSGEIVDSKCYFGVMNPGSGRVHRDCAVRCIRGGIPPVLVGQGRHVVLAGAFARYPVAEPVTVSGELQRIGEMLLLIVE